MTPRSPGADRQVPQGKEVEVDAICDGEDVLIPGIMEHIERAGVHSGDSLAVYPGIRLYPAESRHDRRLHDAHRARARRARADQHPVRDPCAAGVYVLEVNPRVSRTVPFLSKVTGVPMVELATNIMLGKSLRGAGLRGRALAAPAARRRQGARLLDGEAASASTSTSAPR